MTIRTARDFNRFADGLERGITRAAKVGIAKGIGKNLPKLRGTAPVDSREYRQKIDRTPVLVLGGIVMLASIVLADDNVPATIGWRGNWMRRLCPTRPRLPRPIRLNNKIISFWADTRAAPTITF